MNGIPRNRAIDPRRPAGMGGLTLFELLIVMAIAGILAAIAIPSYTYVTRSNRISAEINGLLGDLQFARSEAIKEGQTITVCVSTNLTSCLAGDTSWNNGWIVTSPGSTAPLRVQPAFSGTDTLAAGGGISAITFNREGFATGLAGIGILTLHSAPVVNGATRCLSVSLIGLMAVQPYDGITCL